MTLRTSRSSVTFNAPIRLSAFDDALPAGTYAIDTEEEIIEGNERTVYICVATLLYLRTPGKVRILTIDPAQSQSAHAADSVRRHSDQGFLHIFDRTCGGWPASRLPRRSRCPLARSC